MDEELIVTQESTLYGFDEAWYVKQNPDALNFPGYPLTHYLTIGWREGRNPSPGFDGENYLTMNLDVRQADVCPLLHFLRYGIVEGRDGWRTGTISSNEIETN